MIVYMLRKVGTDEYYVTGERGRESFGAQNKARVWINIHGPTSSKVRAQKRGYKCEMEIVKFVLVELFPYQSTLLEQKKIK